MASEEVIKYSWKRRILCDQRIQFVEVILLACIQEGLRVGSETCHCLSKFQQYETLFKNKL